MTAQAPVVAVTGASGYLGSRICETLESQGWKVIRLVRSPRQAHSLAFAYDLAAPITPQVREVFRSVDALVHAAYDLSLTNAANIWEVNVNGTRRLLEVASEANVRRIIVLSSMSAFDGTTQLYGRAKLDIEALTMEFGGCAVRPGLVYGEHSGGMAEALRKLTLFPIVPVIAGDVSIYTVREEDLMMVISTMIATGYTTSAAISVAHPSRVALADLLRAFAAREARPCRLVPVPWQLVYWLLRAAESLRVHPPFRADSLLGLVYAAPALSGKDQLTRMGITLRAFSSVHAEALTGDRK